MKKIGKYTLSALAKSMSQCDREEMSKFVGGGYKYTFNEIGQLDKVEEVEGDTNFVSAGGSIYDAHAVEVNRLGGFEYHIHSHPGETEKNEYGSYASYADISSGVASLRGASHGKYDYERFEIYIPATEDDDEGEIIDYTSEVKRNLPDRDKEK